MSLFLEYMSLYLFILILLNQLEEMKKEKENVINIFFIIDKLISAESQHSERKR